MTEIRDTSYASKAIELAHVRKALGGKPVLESIDLQVNQKRILGLIGENGAGKTTLLRCIAGIYPSPYRTGL